MISLILSSCPMCPTVAPAVPPAELESVLLKHPDVADSGVVGVVVDGLELPRYPDHFLIRCCRK